MELLIEILLIKVLDVFILEIIQGCILLHTQKIVLVQVNMINQDGYED